MANFGGYPQNVTYQTVNVSAGGGSENLLINPRGKINQANEVGGVLSAGQYFCDGWKAGAAGAEVYVDPDGFRLISGSIVQLVPNNLEAGRTIRGNMDVVSGAPSISINGGSDNVASDAAEYIQFEISGANSKFTRLILAESNSLPIYQQQADELTPCFKFYVVKNNLSGFSINTMTGVDGSWRRRANLPVNMHDIPAVSMSTTENTNTQLVVTATKESVVVEANIGSDQGHFLFSTLIIDARP